MFTMYQKVYNINKNLKEFETSVQSLIKNIKSIKLIIKHVNILMA